MNNNRKNWTKRQENKLMKMSKEGASFDVMSMILGRNKGSIYQRIKMVERRDGGQFKELELELEIPVDGIPVIERKVLHKALKKADNDLAKILPSGAVKEYKRQSRKMLKPKVWDMSMVVMSSLLVLLTASLVIDIVKLIG